MADVTLHLGDCLEYMRGMDAASVDAVITDPPYDKASVPLYGEIARESKRILKDGGFMVAYGGMIHPEVMGLMSEHLDFYWVFVMDLSKSSFARWWSKKIWVNYKPIFAYTKGKPIVRGWFNALHGKDGKDKRYHKWGQGEGFLEGLLEYCTVEGDTVLDPCLGGGTTGVVCNRMNRHFIGCEIDPETFEKAERRITEFQLELTLDMAV
jgi:site-specific DNA-methyltransferase (adenine-specific)